MEGDLRHRNINCTLFEKLGLEKTLKNINGMFAFAYGINKKELFLCRDRIGEKPLYYGYIKNSFVFGSELKAFEQFPMWDRELIEHRYLNL